jgi:hypothetical protein
LQAPSSERATSGQGEPKQPGNSFNAKESDNALQDIQVRKTAPAFLRGQLARDLFEEGTAGALFQRRGHAQDGPQLFMGIARSALSGFA